MAQNRRHRALGASVRSSTGVPPCSRLVSYPSDPCLCRVRLSVSLAYKKEAADTRKTRMNTTLFCRWLSLSISWPRSYRTHTEEVDHSNPFRSLIQRLCALGAILPSQHRAKVWLLLCYSFVTPKRCNRLKTSPRPPRHLERESGRKAGIDKESHMDYHCGGCFQGEQDRALRGRLAQRSRQHPFGGRKTRSTTCKSRH